MIRYFAIGFALIINIAPLPALWPNSKLLPISFAPVESAWAKITLSVKSFGAVGDGLHDDTTAITAALAAARPGDTILFPAGIYVCNDITVTNKGGLTIKGNGNASIIRNGIVAGSTPLMTFAAIRGLTIQDITFDNRSIGSYGGVRFYATENVLITRTRFFDSAPLPLGPTDRYAYVFANGESPHKNISILKNTIEDLQLEVDFGQGVTIQKNTLKRAVRTGAIGLFSVDNGVTLENYLIDGNTIIDPVGAAIAVNIDPPDNTNVAIRNITISNNTIIFNHRPTEAIHLGPGNSSVTATGNIFEEITIGNNLIQIAVGSEAQPGESALIKFNAGPNSGLNFKHTTIRENRIEGGGNPGLPIIGMDARYLEDSMVAANSATNMFTIFAFNRLLNTTVEQNYVGQLVDYFAYVIDNSRGGILFHDNHYSGPATTPLSYENGDSTDIIFPPVYSVTTKQVRLRKR